MSNAVPTVSIIVPVYNAEKYIAATVKSALVQTFKDVELILVDDGSTDGSAAICRSIDDPRVRYVRQANGGVSRARNRGLAEARGRIVAFLDADDLWHEDKLAAHVAHLDSDPTLGVSYGNCQFIDADGALLKAAYRPKLKGVTVADLYCRNPIAGGSSAVFKREVFEAIIEPSSGDGHADYFDVEASARGASYAEDHQCWLRIAIHSELRFEGIDRTLTYYRIHDQGLSANVGTMYQGWRAIDRYVARVRPDLHRSHSNIANAYQMRYYARRLVARGDAREALKFVRRSLGFSLAPFWQEPRKSVATVGAALALWIAPALTTRLLHSSAQPTGHVQ